MKKTFFQLPVFLLLFAVYALCFCKKSGNQEPAGFTWTYNGINYTANIKAAYLYSVSVGPVIIGGTGTSLSSTGIGPSLSLNSLSVGTYIFGTGTSNSFTYVRDNGDILIGDIITLNITANTGSRLSGNFSGILKDPSNSTFSLTGSFVNIQIEN